MLGTVKLRALRPFIGQEGHISEGEEFHVQEDRAKELLQMGTLVEVVKSMPEPTQNKATGPAKNK
jgi:hypothetical protein